MKTIQTIIALILVQFTLNGQTFFESNPEWHIQEQHVGQVEPAYWTFTRIYKLGGDTILGNQTYRIVLKSDHIDTTEFESAGIYLRESGDTIFHFYRGSEEIYMMNGFENSLFFEHRKGCQFIFYDYDTITNLGIRRQVIEYELDLGQNVKNIQGVVYEQNMFWDQLCGFDIPFHEIRCLKRDGELRYKIEDNMPCYLEPTRWVNTTDYTPRIITVHPTIVSDGMNVEIKEITKGTVKFYDGTGRRLGESQIEDGRVKVKCIGLTIMRIIGQYRGDVRLARIWIQ